MEITYTEFILFLLGTVLISMVSIGYKSRFSFIKISIPFLLLIMVACTSFFMTSIKMAPASGLDTNKKQGYLVEVLENKSSKLRIARIVRVAERPELNGCFERVLLINHKESPLEHVEVGDLIWSYGQLKNIDGPHIPFSFDQRKYYRSQYIYRALRLSNDQVFVVKTSTFHFKRLLQQVRTSLKQLVSQHLKSELSTSILLAMLMGDKSDLTPALKDVFSKTGVIHVLAVSGLHVGIIYLLVQFLLKILFVGKLSRKSSTLLLLCAIWSFAILSGLSPSVTRASFMFSLIAAGKAFNKDASIYNILACSAFIILCVDPARLYDLGFQLSYAAVLGIVSIYPLLNILCPSSNTIVIKLWSMLSVSTAAQIGTLPITLYYFNQFPIYFLIANLIAIPSTSILLSLGIGLILFSRVGVISEWMTSLINTYVEFVVYLLKGIYKWPHASIQIYLKAYFVPIIFACLILAILAFYFGKKKLILITLGVISTVLVCNVVFPKSVQNRVYLSNVGGQCILGIANEGNHSCFLFDKSSNTTAIDRRLSKFWMSKGWDVPNYVPLESSELKSTMSDVDLVYGDAHIWILNKSNFEKGRLNTTTHPAIIVFNGSSNYSILDEVQYNKDIKVFAMNLFNQQYIKLESLCAEKGIKYDQMEYYDLKEWSFNPPSE